MNSNMKIEYKESPTVNDEDIDTLFLEAWGAPKGNYRNVLTHSLLYICAYAGGKLIGFVNVAWDGGSHGFVLDTSVMPQFRRQGIGSTLIKRASEAAKKNGLEWLHVDFEPKLASFYRKAGFSPTNAGLLNLAT